MINVVLQTGEDRRKTVTETVEQLGDEFFSRLKQAENVLLKVNLVHHENQLASTHVDAVRGVLDVIRTHARAQVFVGDASYHGTKAAFRHFGYEHLPSEYEKVTLVDLNDDDHVPGYSYRRDGSLNEIRIAKTAFEADVKISLTNMKMHRDTGVSLSVKNWTIGTWVAPPRNSMSGRIWARWPWLHEEGPWAHHASVAALYKQMPCDVAIVDGMVAMQGDGPSRGTAVQMGVVLAGFDAVAVDSVAATLMGVDPREVGYLALCGEWELGVNDMARINVPPMLVHEYSRQLDRPLGFEERLEAWRKEEPEHMAPVRPLLKKNPSEETF